MDRRQLAAIMTELHAVSSRRQVLGSAVRGTIGGLGAALMVRGIDSGLVDSALAGVPRAGGAIVNVVDFAFEPARIDVPVGTTVTWTNYGAKRHTVTAVDGSFDQELAPGGGAFSHTFTTPGAYDYYCAIHPAMTGTVNAGDPTSPVTYVRPNVHSLDPYGPELMAYAAAIEEMQALPNTDPLSWAYQANMHATWLTPPPPEPPPAAELPGWTTCEHGSLFFWPWHRMYLYWFERIIREMSGYAEFALPYWDYANPAQRVLPAPFLDPASSLYVAERDADVNAGLPPGANVPLSIFDHCGGLAETIFDFASFSLEGTPHGAVHVWVAGVFGTPPTFGWMGAFETAARDPVFWLHHSNLDRLWESWLALGNLNTADPAWLNNDVNSGNGRTYDFFDTAGAQVTTVRVVKEVVDAVAQLGYQYEALTDLTGCPGFLMAAPSDEDSTPPATPEAPIELGRSSQDAGIEIGATPTTVPVTLEQADAAAGLTGVPGTTVLTLDGVRGTGVPAVAVEVYINLPAGQTPDFRGPYYVGNLNLFGLLSPHDAAHAEQSATQRFNITPNVAALEASGEWTEDLEVTFVPYYTASTVQPETGAAADETIPPPGPWVTVESITVTTR